MKPAIISFIVGAVCYTATELIYRGRTHISMTIAGGICMLVLYLIFRLNNKISLPLRCVISMLVITGVEFITGLIVNKWLGLDVWDYSNRKLNVLGQICPLFSFYWFLMGIPISITSDILLRYFP